MSSLKTNVEIASEVCQRHIKGDSFEPVTTKELETTLNYLRDLVEFSQVMDMGLLNYWANLRLHGLRSVLIERVRSTP